MLDKVQTIHKEEGEEGLWRSVLEEEDDLEALSLDVINGDNEEFEEDYEEKVGEKVTSNRNNIEEAATNDRSEEEEVAEQVQYSTVLYCTVLYCIVLYCTVLCTVLYRRSLNRFSRSRGRCQWSRLDSR